MGLASKHVTLSREGFQGIVGTKIQVIAGPVPADCSFSQLCQAALNADVDVTYLWVMPDTGIQCDRKFVDAARGAWDIFAAYDIDDEFAEQTQMPQSLVTAVCFKLPKGGQRQLNIYFPVNGQWAWGNDETTDVEVLQIVYSLEKQLGIQIGNSPSTAGMKLLEKIFPPTFSNRESQKRTKTPHAWLTPATIDLLDLPFTKSAMDVIDARQLTTAEKKHKYLYKFDVNSAYLRGCVEVQVGAGNPEHVGSEQFDVKVPGSWLVTVTGQRDLSLPSPVPSGVDWATDIAAGNASVDYTGWLATPILKMLQQSGYSIQVHEGWAYTDKNQRHGTLKKWAQTLWEGRQYFQAEAKSAKNPYWETINNYCDTSVKQIAVSTLGLTGSTKFGKGEISFKKRPDWRAQSVAEIRANMFYKMRKFAEQGYSPVIVYMDALYYTSNDPNPETAIPGILDHKDSLGGLKCEWRLPLDKKVKQILSSDTNPSEKLGLLNDYVEEIGNE